MFLEALALLSLALVLWGLVGLAERFGFSLGYCRVCSSVLASGFILSLLSFENAPDLPLVLTFALGVVAYDLSARFSNAFEAVVKKEQRGFAKFGILALIIFNSLMAFSAWRPLGFLFQLFLVLVLGWLQAGKEFPPSVSVVELASKTVG